MHNVSPDPSRMTSWEATARYQQVGYWDAPAHAQGSTWGRGLPLRCFCATLGGVVQLGQGLIPPKRWAVVSEATWASLWYATH